METYANFRALTIFTNLLKKYLSERKSWLKRKNSTNEVQTRYTPEIIEEMKALLLNRSKTAVKPDTIKSKAHSQPYENQTQQEKDILSYLNDRKDGIVFSNRGDFIDMIRNIINS
jgi:predicted choloylglycine hydrolase